jgi:hypothetical protein
VPDTLRCNRTIGTIQVNNNTTTGYYTWATSNGDIVSANTDSSQLKIDKPGTYILSASPAQGCPATRKDTIVIPIDTFPPVASVNIVMPPGNSYLQLYGGNPTASNYSTPFGGSQGLLYDWSGPAAFTSTIQNPRTADTTWGTYQLTVTEKRNGCTRTASQSVSRYNFIVLLANDPQPAGLPATNASYRPQYYLAGNAPASGALSLIANSDGEHTAVIACYDIIGEVLWRKTVRLNQGMNTIGLAGPADRRLATQILSVYVDGKMAYTAKVVR